MYMFLRFTNFLSSIFPMIRFMFDTFPHLTLVPPRLPFDSLRVNTDMGETVYASRIANDSEILGTIARTSTYPKKLDGIECLVSDETRLSNKVGIPQAWESRGNRSIWWLCVLVAQRCIALYDIGFCKRAEVDGFVRPCREDSRQEVSRRLREMILTLHGLNESADRGVPSVAATDGVGWP